MDELKKSTMKCDICEKVHEVIYHPMNEWAVKNGCFILICKDCENEGYWIDPAGGLHHPNEDDPAKMYE